MAAPAIRPYVPEPIWVGVRGRRALVKRLFFDDLSPGLLG
jgi:hypothetical protein